MAKKSGHTMGDMKGGSMIRTDSGEYEASICFANGVKGTGKGKTKPEAQHAAVEDAKHKSVIAMLASNGYVLVKT